MREQDCRTDFICGPMCFTCSFVTLRKVRLAKLVIFSSCIMQVLPETCFMKHLCDFVSIDSRLAVMLLIFYTGIFWIQQLPRWCVQCRLAPGKMQRWGSVSDIQKWCVIFWKHKGNENGLQPPGWKSHLAIYRRWSVPSRWDRSRPILYVQNLSGYFSLKIWDFVVRGGSNIDFTYSNRNM